MQSGTRLRLIQAGFAEQCEELLETMVNQARDKDPWKIYLAKGAGDRAIAGDHEERHVLELLQNARDAIYRDRCEGDRSKGRIFIAVTDYGMAVANTGAPFRLNDEDVLEAVRFLMRSEKTGKGFVGHKGIGLKSILLRAGAFSVRSRIRDEILKATFSRHRTAQHLLARMEETPDAFPDQQRILEELPRLPLFTQPHSDSADQDALQIDTDLVEGLLRDNADRMMGLNENGLPSSLQPYVTVVYLPYLDNEWEQLLDSIEGEKLEAQRLQTFRRARQRMGTVSAGSSADEMWRELTELDPRVLVLLGEVAEVQFARFRERDLVEVRRIDIEYPISSPKRHETSSEEIRLAIRCWTESEDTAQSLERRAFVVLSTPTELDVEYGGQSDEGPAEYIRILVEQPSTDSVTLRNEPLFLYYPIKGDLSGLPIIIHGPFRVNSSRTALVPSQEVHNRQVLKEAVELLKNSVDVLLKPQSALRSWLPWVLLPQADPEEDASAIQGGLQSELVQWIIDLLKATPCVPTARGNACPADVHFFPSRPEALSLLEDLSANHLRLLARENRLTYERLSVGGEAHWERAASSIDLGGVDRMSFFQTLADHLSQAARHNPMQVNVDQARSFFQGVCSLLIGEDGKIDRAAAEILGKSRIPLLPAISGNREDQDDEGYLLLVPTEPRREETAPTKQQASRVVFWRPSNVRSRIEEAPPPPDSIPIYFIDQAVVEAEGARAEGILSTLYDEWGTTRFESRPDLFRRVADRVVDLPSRDVVPVLGYLAGLLHSIHSESFSGADDLEPRPYAAIELGTLRNFLNVYCRNTNQRTLDRQRLESLQAWSRILVPAQDRARGQHLAHTVAFGPDWAAFLEENVQLDEAASEEDRDPPTKEWGKAIRALASFRQLIGRAPDDPFLPEIASPDDPRWEPARQQLRRVVADLPPKQETLALFHLLLLFGVRIGPRAEWRWLNNQRQAEPFDSQTHAVNLDTCWNLVTGDEVADDVFPSSLSQTALMRAYRRYIVLEPYHPAFSGDHSWGHRDHLLCTGELDSRLAAWIWLPDLVDADLDTPAFSGNQATIDAFLDALLAAWPQFAAQALWTGWYCQNWHNGRSWKYKIPSLAAFQLSHLALWRARSDGRVSDVANRRFPAGVMVAWDREEPPSATEPAGFFPMMDVLDETLSRVARDLSVSTLSDLSFSGAVTRLRWLLEESRVEEGAPGCWLVAEYEGSSRDAWLAAQYRLLDRIVHHDPTRLWDRRTIVECGFALRAVRNEQQCAVPIVIDAQGNPKFAIEVAFFPQPPRYWEREANAGRWILETQRQLQTALYRWAENLGAQRITPTDPPAYKGTPIENPEAVAVLQREVKDRLVLILGAFRAHRAEKLDEMAGKVIEAAERLYPAARDPLEEKRWSGLGSDGCIVFSIQDYQDEQVANRSGAVVLAEGLALLVEQTTAVGDLQQALSAPKDQVERALRFRGVDLEELTREITALAQERLRFLLERTERLLWALGRAMSLPVSLPGWEIEDVADEEWVIASETFKAAEGPLAEQVLAAIASAAPDLPPSSRALLLRTFLDEDLAARGDLPMGRALLNIVRDVGWDAEKRAALMQAGLVDLPQDLAKRQEVCSATLNLAVLTALVERLIAGELDGTDEIDRDLYGRGWGMRDTLRVPPLEADVRFLDGMGSSLRIPMDFEPPGLLLIEWGEKTWQELGQALRQIVESRLEEFPDELRDFAVVFKQCLDEGSLGPLREHGQREQNERQTRIRVLEKSLEEGELTFAPEAMSVFTANAPLGKLDAQTTEPGRGAGGNGVVSVTVDQAVRGRLAELFVLEVCWRRFLSLDGDGRVDILEQIAARRADSDSDVSWGTAAAWKRLKSKLAQSQDDLLICPSDPHETPSELSRLFKELIQVANERGPGFDVLDPFGEWGTKSDGSAAPRRVEVKAILPPTESEDGHRVVLTTNEFHRARRRPESYVLRLIYVPKDYQDVGAVQWACDIADPVNALQLNEKIVLGVRSGMLPFIIRPAT